MKRHGGFTMVELIVVMVLIGIVAAVAAPRLLGSNSYAPLVLRDQIQAALRHAQKSAVARRRVICATQPNGAAPPTFSIAAGSADTGCSLAFPNTIDVGVLGNTGLQTFWDDLPATLYFQPDGSITDDFAGASPRVGKVTFKQDNISYEIKLDGGTGYVE